MNLSFNCFHFLMKSYRTRFCMNLYKFKIFIYLVFPFFDTITLPHINLYLFF